MPGDGNYSPNESQEEAPPERGAGAGMGATVTVDMAPGAAQAVGRHKKGPDRSRGQLSHNHWEVNHDQINTITHHVLVKTVI